MIMANFHLRTLSLAVTTSLILTACGGSDNGSTTSNNTSTPNTSGVKSLATGKLLAEPSTFKTLTPEQIKQATLSIEPATANAIGDPKCGVSVQYMHYDTLDAKGKPTDATGAVFVPTGNDPSCKGNRPVVLHAHGTAVQQNFNFAEVGNPNNEAGLRATSMANIFAGQGYIVIAPNYAGYDKSKLDYHPYLNAEQQSHEMGDALKAGREVLNKVANLGVKDNGKLFLTGYSQGGHVALATAKYFEKIHEPVTALMPMSGPYAMGAFGDVVFGGNVMVGGTYFAPLMARSFQEQFGNINANELFAPQYASTMMSLLPAKADITGKLPTSALFQNNTGITTIDAVSPADPKFAFGFDNANYLLNTTYRASYLADMQKNPDWSIPYFKGNTSVIPVVASNPENTLRQALKANDLRDYVPKAPVILCGGNQDPMVFFDVNTTLTHGLWSNLYGKAGGYKFGMVDLDVSNQATRNRDVYKTQGLATVADNAVKAEAEKMQQAFTQNIKLIGQNAAASAMAQLASVPNLTDAQKQATAQSAATYAVMSKYHNTAAPYCMATARTFFSQF